MVRDRLAVGVTPTEAVASPEYTERNLVEMFETRSGLAGQTQAGIEGDVDGKHWRVTKFESNGRKSLSGYGASIPPEGLASNLDRPFESAHFFVGTDPSGDGSINHQDDYLFPGEGLDLNPTTAASKIAHILDQILPAVVPEPAQSRGSQTSK